MSVAMRDRERDRDWDSRSYGGGGGDHRDRPSRVTVKRYQVAERGDDDRFDTASRASRRDLNTPQRSDFRESSNVREYKYEREVERGGDRGPDRDLYDYRSERARSPPSQYRNRSPSDHHRDSQYREIHIDREVSRDPPRRDRDRYDELDHYTKTTDYYSRQEAPQPIIIRNDAPPPIIIRESAPQPLVIREERAPSIRAPSVRSPSPKSQMIERQMERTEINEDRTVARRDPSPEPQHEEDEYYYQRTTREIARRDEDHDDRRSRRRARRDDSRNGYSEDDYYYKKTVEGGRTRSSSRKRLELAGGAAVGMGAAALLNRRRQQDGQASGGVKNLAAGAVVGTAGAELVRRARSRYRGDSGSRSRSRSRDYYQRGERRRSRRRAYSEERSRSKSREGTSNLAKLGAVAAIGAIAGYAASRRGKNRELVADDRRSRSRRRRDSRDRSISSSGSDRARSPGKSRNATIAKAGLASAAVAGLVDRVRSKSRGGARSKSRLRTGGPIAAAGLGGAALAGLYENQKAKKENRQRDRSLSGSRSPTSRERSRNRGRNGRARSRSMTAPGYVDSRGVPQDDQNLIEYGGDPVYPGAGAHERPRSRADDSLYSEQVRRRGSPGSSNSASPRRRRYADRSRSRDRGAADGAAGAGVAGVAAHEASKRRERKRAERERRRQEEAAQESPQAHGGTYGFGPYGQEPPPAPLPPNQYAEQAYYPPGNSMPPPPNAYAPVPNFIGQEPQPPQEYGAHPAYAPQPGAPGAESYGYQPPGPGAPYHPNVSDASTNSGQERTDVNELHPVLDLHTGEEGRRHSKSVAFNLTPSVHQSPQLSPRSLPASAEQSPTYDGASGRNQTGDPTFLNVRHDENITPSRSSTSTASRRDFGPGSRPYCRRRARRTTESGDDVINNVDRPQQGRAEVQQVQGNGAASQQDGHDSDETISLPDRFDEHGRKKADGDEHASVQGVHFMASGSGTVGGLFQRLASDLLRGIPRSRDDS